MCGYAPLGRRLIFTLSDTLKIYLIIIVLFEKRKMYIGLVLFIGIHLLLFTTAYCCFCRVGNEILNECLDDVADELEQINGDIAEHVYRCEFATCDAPPNGVE